MCNVGIGHNMLGDKNMSSTRRCLTHVGQNLNALLIIPIVKDQLEDIGVSNPFPLGDDASSVELTELVGYCSASHRLTFSAGMRNSFSPDPEMLQLTFPDEQP
jgi:hypothetical protein